MADLICIRWGYAVFLDPGKDICYKTGGLFCRRLKSIVSKYDPCRIATTPKKLAKKAGKK